MRNLIIGIVLGAVVATAITVLAKTEATSTDAASVVAYGYNGTSLVAISVKADGTVNIQ